MNKLSLILILITIKVGAQTPTFIIADSLYAVGNYPEAIQQLEDLQEQSDAAQLRLAKVYVTSGDLNSALKTYKIILQKNPNKVLSTMEYGQVLVNAGELYSADSLFNLLSIKHPENASFQFQIGSIKERLADSTYLDYLHKTIILDSTHQHALFKIARYELSRRNFTMAEKMSMQGLLSNPNNGYLLSILAQTYIKENSFVLAIPPLEKLLELGEGNEFVHSKLGFCYYHQNNFEDAIEQYKLALSYEDRNSDSHYNLGKLYAKLGDLKRSETHLLMALLIKKQPVDAEFLSLALTYKLQEDYKKALQYFNSALEENPYNERALYERAIAADNYYKDKTTVLNHYKAYLNRYEAKGDESLIFLAQSRMKDIREELHLMGE